MAYDRLDLETGDTLDADVFRRIDDGIEHADKIAESLYGDLYNIKKTTEIVSTSKTATLTSSSFDRPYPNVGGLASIIGKPSVISKVSFPVKPSASGNITSVTCSIYELPDDSSESIWDKPLATKTVVLDKAITNTNSYSIVSVTFDEDIVNENDKYLLARIWFGGGGFKVNLGLNLVTFEDIPYNPGWFYCASTGNGIPSKATGDSYGDPNSKQILCMAFETFQIIRNESGNLILDTSESGKFFNLVEKSLLSSSLANTIYNSRQKGLQMVSNTCALTSGMTSASFSRYYPNVGGLASVIGAPEKFNVFKFPVQPTSSGPITGYTCTIYELPNTNDSTLLWGKVLGEKIVELETPITDTSRFTIAEVTFDSEIINPDGKYLLAKIWFGGGSFKVNLGLTDNTFDDIPYNPGWFYCASTGDGTPSKATKSNPASVDESDSKLIRCISSECYLFNPENVEYYVDTSSTGKFYKQVSEVFETMGGSIETSGSGRIPPMIYLPSQYDLVVGDTFQLFYASVIRSFEVDNEGACAICSVGYNFPRYYEFTPTETHSGKTYSLRLVTRSLDGAITCEATTKLVVHPKITNETSPSNINMLCFGDSLTASGTWCSEGLRRIYGTSTSASGPASLGVTNTVTTYGSKRNTNNTFQVYHEGYGGWTWASFLNTAPSSSSTTNGIIVTLSADHNYDINMVQKSIWIDNNGLNWELEDFPQSNQIKFNRGEGNISAQKNINSPITLTCSSLNYSIVPTAVVWESENPFFNPSTETVDFVAHAEKYNNPGPDIVAVLLTWNSTGSSLQFEKIPSAVETHMDNAASLFRIIHQDYPNAKIVVMGLTPCSMTGGRGTNGGAAAGVADRFSGLFYAMEYSKALEELCLTTEFKDFCYYNDTKGQFDAIYSLPYTQKAVNTRSKVTELFGTNGVHPNTEGYYQIGDAFYRALTKVIPIVKTIKEA